MYVIWISIYIFFLKKTGKKKNKVFELYRLCDIFLKKKKKLKKVKGECIFKFTMKNYTKKITSVIRFD